MARRTSSAKKKSAGKKSATKTKKATAARSASRKKKPARPKKPRRGATKTTKVIGDVLTGAALGAVKGAAEALVGPSHEPARPATAPPPSQPMQDNGRM